MLGTKRIKGAEDVAVILAASDRLNDSGNAVLVSGAEVLLDGEGLGAAELTREERMLVPCVLSIGGVRLSLFTTLVTFGSPRDVTLAELTVELFYPADDATAERRNLVRDAALDPFVPSRR